MGHNIDDGPLGYGVIPGEAPESGTFRNCVMQGLFVNAPTTASAQLTGTGNGSYRVDITQGIVHVDGYIAEAAAAADLLLETAGNIMASGYSKVYTVIYWAHPSTGVISRKIVGGTAALTGAQVAPTTAEIEAVIPDGAYWVPVANVTMNRTGDTTVTQSQVNTVRPSLLAKTVSRP